MGVPVTMPDSGLPRWAQVAGRLARVAIYALGVVVGIGDVWVRSDVIADAVGVPWVLVWGWLALASGTIGALAVIAWRWRWELVASAALAFAFAARAVGVWATVDDLPSRIAPAAVMTIAALSCLLRALDLSVFASRTSAMAIRVRRRARS